MRSFFKIFVFCFIALVGITVFKPSYAMGQFMFFGHPLEGRQVDDFTLNNLQGQEVNFEKIRDGKAAILFFWATWCPHCLAQLPQLNREADVWAEKGIKVILIDLEEDVRTVKSYMTKTGIALPLLLDTEGEVGKQFAVMGVPSYFFIDQNGIIKAVKHQLPENVDEIFSKVRGKGYDSSLSNRLEGRPGLKE